jgi:hypothetical protein
MGVILSATPVPLQFNNAGGTGGETRKTTQHSGNVSERFELA